MTAELQQRYDAEMVRHSNVIAQLANDRLAELAVEWKKTSDKSLSIDFIMGTEIIRVGTEPVDEWDYPLIEDALKDVWEITLDYRRGCPDSLKVEVG